MYQFKQAGVGVVSNNDLLNSEFHRETNIAGAISSPEEDSGYDAGDVLSKVAILLCTYYGQHYLAQQLDSFTAQSHSNLEVWASDDGSQDNAHAILEAYQQEWSPVPLPIHFGSAAGRTYCR